MNMAVRAAKISTWHEKLRSRLNPAILLWQASRPLLRAVIGILLAAESLALILHGLGIVLTAASGYLNDTNVYFFYVAQGGRVLIWFGLMGLWVLSAPAVAERGIP